MLDKDGGFVQMSRTGRPKLDDPREHKISVRFSDEQLERLMAYCGKHGLNKAQVLMKGFEELEHQDEEADHGE